jgi:dTDP-4-amino-4,6-dideoxygalactose transaminase
MGALDGKLGVLPPLPPSTLSRRPAPAPFPFDDPGCRIYDFGRNALWHGIGALALEPGDELLMPAYHCGTEIGPAVDRGLVPRFWGGTDDLEPDETELERLLGPRTRGLYLIHHLGFAQDVGRWRAWCDRRNLLLLEDVSPSWPGRREGRPLGSWGDLAIFSPWKMFGLPEAGALLCTNPPPALAATPPAPTRELALAFARWPAQRTSLSLCGRRGRHVSGGEPVDPAEEFAVHDPDRGLATVTWEIFRRVWDDDFAERRRRNYEWLLERVGERVTPPFDRSPEEGCPFELPVSTTDKGGFGAHLAARGIAAVDYWSRQHPALPTGAFPAIDRRRETTLVLPVHQGLRRRDLERIADAIASWPADR